MCYTCRVDEMNFNVMLKKLFTYGGISLISKTNSASERVIFRNILQIYFVVNIYKSTRCFSNKNEIGKEKNISIGFLWFDEIDIFYSVFFLSHVLSTAIVSLQVLEVTLSWKLYKNARKILTKVKTKENSSAIFYYK